jgi:hypothetical protein
MDAPAPKYAIMSTVAAPLDFDKMRQKNALERQKVQEIELFLDTLIVK